MTLSKNITIHCSLECLGSIQPTSVFHSTVITVSVHLIPSVDVAISGDTDVSIQTQAKAFRHVEEVISNPWINASMRYLAHSTAR